METHCGFCEVRTEFLHASQKNFMLEGVEFSVSTLLCRPHRRCSFGQLLHREQNCDPKIVFVVVRKLFAGQFVTWSL
jgi:hypothetical protein